MTNAAADPTRGQSVDIGPVALWVDVQGSVDGEPIVLLTGAETPGFRWTPAIVDPLVNSGYRVVRFDYRDCGRSTRFGAGDGYSLLDMADDVVALLDHLSIAAAHLVGRSMGGMIAQIIALDHPGRVRSLTFIGTTPGAGDERLAGPDDDFVEKMTLRLFEGPPRELEEQVEWIVDLAGLMNGPLYPLDRVAEAALARAEIETGWAAETGHGVAVHSSPSRLDRLAEIDAPTLVVHGTVDPVFPIDHGRALAEGISGAVYIEVEGLGHEVPDAFATDLWPVLQRHLSASSAWPDHT